MRTAIDTNILSAILGGETSAGQIAEFLDRAASQGSVVISPVVYMELRAHPAATEAFVDRFLAAMRMPVDWSFERNVWMLAADRFAQYAERRGVLEAGEARRLTSDFMIAAHAVLRADRLVTFDRRRYRTDFPELPVVEL